MATPLLTRRSVYAAKIETTLGTAVSLANTDAAFKIYNAKLSPKRVSFQRNRMSSGGNDIAIAEEASTEFTGDIIVHGKGSAGSPNWAATFLPAMGFVEGSGAVWTRTWTTSNFKGLTVGEYVDGTSFKGRGMMGSGKFTFIPGKKAVFNVNLMGGYSAVPGDESILSSITYEDVVPPIWEPNSNTPLTLDGATTFAPSQLEIDLGNDTSLREDPNAEMGYRSGWIGSANEIITLDPEAYLRATYDMPTKHAGNTTMTLALILGSSANNILTIGATVQPIEHPLLGDRNGKATESVRLLVINDSLTLTFS